MSMDTLTILQLAGVSIAFFLLMFAAPAAALWKHLKGMRVTAKLLICFITANAYSPIVYLWSVSSSFCTSQTA